MELSSKGRNQSEIEKILQVNKSIVSRDILFFREQSKQNIRKYVDEKLPEEYEKCLIGLNAVLKEAWDTSQNTQDNREKMQALTLAKDCYSMKFELLTNATIVDDALKLVTTNLKGKNKKDDEIEKPKAFSSDNNIEHSKHDIQRPKEENNEPGIRLTTNQTF